MWSPGCSNFQEDENKYGDSGHRPKRQLNLDAWMRNWFEAREAIERCGVAKKQGGDQYANGQKSRCPFSPKQGHQE